MKLKKIASIMASCVLALGMMTALSGCGPSDEEQITKAVTNTYDAYKNADSSSLSEIVTSLENEAIKELGIDNTEFATVIVEGFDYAIEGIQIDGNKATVSMMFAGKSYTEMLNKISETTDKLANDPAFATLPQDQRLSTAGQMVMNAFKELPVKNEQTTLEYVRENGTWKAAETQAGLTAIDNVLFAK